MRFPAILRVYITMKLEPKHLPFPSGQDRSVKRGLLHSDATRELDPDQVRRRANCMSGVLKDILNRCDSPEHISLRK